MLRLLRIDLLKLANYKAFWVLNILYGILIVGVPVGVMEFMKWLKRLGEDFDNFDPMRIPILHFPDIWQNVTYVYTFFRIFLAIIVIISISNEFSYKTIRQNVIDGMSRLDFVKSKMSTILLLAIGSTLLVFITGTLTGMIYTPKVEFSNMFTEIEFIFAYFLDLLAFLIFAFFLTVYLKRSALTVFVLLLYRPVEAIFIAILPDSISFIGEYFPLQSVANMIEVPFPRYAFQEIQDFVPYKWVVISIAWMGIFLYGIYSKLKNSDV